MSNDITPNEWSTSRPLVIGFSSLILLVLGVGLWSITTQISGAVIARGRIQVEANHQVIQHPTGGVVRDIMVSEGSIVEAGDVVIRFDDSGLKSELGIVESQYFELIARKALFKAEQNDKSELVYDAELMTRAEQDPNILSLMDGQSNFFIARRASLDKQKEQLAEQTIQLNNQVTGVEAQKRANQTQLELLKEELTNAQTLLDKGLTQVSRVLVLLREKARISGQVGSLTADLGRLKAAINGINIQLLQLDAERRRSAIESLRDIGYRVLELAERRISIKQSISQLSVRAPMSGIVHGNQIFALQSVVQPAQPMMYIIPSDLPLVVQAQLDVVHADQVYVGQNTTLNFSAFSQRTTPKIFGTVTKLSADAFTDQVSGLNYYQVELVPNQSELVKLKNLELLPGMPVEAFLNTDDRSAFSYLIKPVTDYFNKAFREE